MVDLHEVMSELTLDDIRTFMFKIITGVHFAHSKGIMHRDIKIHNILVSMKTKEVKIIDWGLSEFYHPLFPYSLKVCTKFYRAPELLVGYQQYDYSLDMWCIGVLFAELLINKFPLIN